MLRPGYWDKSQRGLAVVSAYRSFYLAGAPIVTIGVVANSQCENRCWFVATQIAAVISERQEIKIV